MLSLVGVSIADAAGGDGGGIDGGEGGEEASFMVDGSDSDAMVGSFVLFASLFCIRRSYY